MWLTEYQNFDQAELSIARAGSRSTITTVRIADSTGKPRTTLVPGSPKPLLQTRPHLSSSEGCTTLL